VVTVRLTTKDRKEPDWTKARMILYGPNDKKSLVSLGRPGTEGFTALGCDGGGTWTVFYEPKWEEICMGRTRVEFVVPDPATGQDIKKEYWIDTP
jgi:hypothetical protein